MDVRHCVAGWFIASWVGVLVAASSAEHSQLRQPQSQTFKLGTNVIASFAPLELAQRILTNRDDFIAALSPFDRAVRLKTERPASEEQLLGLIQKSVLPWSREETERLGQVLKTVGEKLAAWPLPFPTNILLIKTSGREEANACYTRQHAIILPERETRSTAPALETVLLHELFHVLSRQNPELRKSLYQIIGFQPIAGFELPETLRLRKLTNPDGVQISWCIFVTNGDRVLPVVPITYAAQDRYDARSGGGVFDYLVFQLLVVERSDGRWKAELNSGQPRLIPLGRVSGFFEQVGRNTQYVIHPDEILADNFVQLIHGETNVPTPRILAEMRKVLTNARP